MKKLLSLMLLCMVCMGAWAEGSSYSEVNAAGGKLIQLQSWYRGGNYLTVDGSNVKVSQQASMSRFLLVPATSGNFYLQHQGSGLYVGRTANSASQAVPVATDQASAGIFHFEAETPGGNPASGSFTSSTTCVYIKCMNPGTTSYPSLYNDANNANIKNWDTTTSGAGNAWVVTAIEDAPAVVFADQLKDRATYAMVNIQPNGNFYYLNSNGDALEAPNANVVTNGYEWPASAKFVAEKVSEGQYAFKNVANSKYLAYKRFDAEKNADLSVWNVSAGTRYNGANIKTFYFYVNKRTSTDATKGSIILSNAGNFDNWQTGECTTNAGYSNTYGFVLLAEPSGITPEQIEALQNKIDGLMSHSGYVGYPDPYSTEASTLFGTYSTWFEESVTAENYEAAEAALSNYLNCTDILLPQDGKAYKIWNVMSNGNKRAVYYDGTNMKTGTTWNPTTATDGDVFICHHLSDNNFVFVAPSNGKYMHLVADGKNQVFDEAYTEASNKVSITKMPASTTAGGSDYSAANVENTFGLVLIKGDISDGSRLHYLMGTTSGKFANTQAGGLYFTAAAQSSGFAFEEVGNPNKVKLTNPNPDGTSGLDNKYVGTFSAPYNVNLPEGVKAYKASVEGTTVTFTEIGNVVPKNVGVLVYKEGASIGIDALAVPATSTTNVDDNAFVAVVNGTIAAGKYVLGNGTNGVGFYARVNESAVVKNKAYLEVPAGEIRSYRFDFEEQTTGVESLQSEQTTGVAFDLAGRRINANAKGISIVNGKKYIK